MLKQIQKASPGRWRTYIYILHKKYIYYRLETILLLQTVAEGSLRKRQQPGIWRQADMALPPTSSKSLDNLFTLAQPQLSPVKWGQSFYFAHKVAEKSSDIWHREGGVLECDRQPDF